MQVGNSLDLSALNIGTSHTHTGNTQAVNETSRVAEEQQVAQTQAQVSPPENELSTEGPGQLLNTVA